MKKQDIFDTALSLIVTRGLHATPMAQIAKEANVAAGTIYHYFNSKEEMIHELYLLIQSELKQQMNADELDMNNFETEFSSLCLRIFKYLIQNPMKFYFLQQFEKSPHGNGVEEFNHHIEFPIEAAFFQLGMKHNLLKSMPVSLMSNLVYDTITVMVRLQLAEQIELNKELIQIVIDGCWNMIRK